MPGALPRFGSPPYRNSGTGTAHAWAALKNKTSGQGFSPPLAAAPTDPSFRDA